MDASPVRVVCAVFANDQPFNTNTIVGWGIDGYVLRHGPSSVLKIPKLDAAVLPDGSFEMDPDGTWLPQILDNEKEAYQRLEGVRGLTKCLGMSSKGIELEYHGNGDMEDYIKTHPLPPWSQRLGWILQIVNFVVACHERKVLWFDIALRNLLLADDWTIRAIDFNNSTVAPSEIDLDTAELDGYTAKLEVLHLINVVFSISR